MNMKKEIKQCAENSAYPTKLTIRGDCGNDGETSQRRIESYPVNGSGMGES